MIILFIPYFVLCKEPVITQQAPPSPMQKEVTKARTSVDCIKGYLKEVIAAQQANPAHKYPTFVEYEKVKCQPPIPLNIMIAEEKKSDTGTISTLPPSQ